MWTQPGSPYVPLAGAIRWDLAWKGCLLCGIGAAALSAIPIVSIGCCLWMLGAGMLAVNLYRRRVPDSLVTPGMGMKIGAVTGLCGWIVNALVTALSFVMQRTSNDIRQAMQDQMKKQIANAPDPKVQQAMEQMMAWISTPQGMATTMVFILVFMGVVFLFITAAGGALGASMIGKRREMR
jgi:hypothetical protein